MWFLSYNLDYGPEKPVKPGTPFAELPNNGGLGGSALKYFRLTIDYPRGVAWFSR